MASKKRGKTAKREVVHHRIEVPRRRRMHPDKSEAIMALMAIILVVLCTILDLRVAVAAAVILMGMFAVYKLFKKSQ